MRFRYTGDLNQFNRKIINSGTGRIVHSLAFYICNPSLMQCCESFACLTGNRFIESMKQLDSLFKNFHPLVCLDCW